MRIIPVMDLKGGRVVHAVGGRRDEYLPIRSRLVHSSCPEIVAYAFRDQLGLRDLYIADLDAIAGADPVWNIYGILKKMGLRLMVDAGLRDVTTAQALERAGVSDIVIGLETIADRTLVRGVLDEVRSAPVWFSLDLKDGLPMVRADTWPESTAEAITAEVVSMGVSRLIVLDVARVGSRCGTATESLCRRILAEHSSLELIAGGGIRDRTDLDRLRQVGVAGALVATALHELLIP